MAKKDYYITALGRQRSSYSVLVVSDLHDGGHYSICSEFPYISAGDTYHKLNPTQKNLLYHWETLNDRMSKKPLVCTVNGEFIDGANRKNAGVGQWSTDMSDQGEDAVKLMRMIKADIFNCTKGSPYHSRSESMNVDQMVAKKINAMSSPGFTHKRVMKKGVNIIRGQNEGYYISHFLTYRILHYVFNIVHKVGYSRHAALRSTPLSKEMFIGEFEKDKAFNKEDVEGVKMIYLRSHTHHLGDVGSSNTRGIITPSWKVTDDFIGQTGVSTASIGALELILDTNEMQWVYHELPDELRPKYKIPDLTPAARKQKEKLKKGGSVKFK